MTALTTTAAAADQVATAAAAAATAPAPAQVKKTWTEGYNSYVEFVGGPDRLRMDPASCTTKKVMQAVAMLFASVVCIPLSLLKGCYSFAKTAVSTSYNWVTEHLCSSVKTTAAASTVLPVAANTPAATPEVPAPTEPAVAPT